MNNKKTFKTAFDALLNDGKSSPSKDKKIYTKSTFILDRNLLDKLKAIAYFERKSLKDIINYSVDDYIRKYEIENGVIELPKQK